MIAELLVPTKKINKVEEVRKIEGSCFGCPIYGYNDGIITFMSKLWSKL
jgi:fused-like protein